VKPLRLSLCAALAVFAITAAAQQPTAPQPQPDDPLARVLFPPELVMQHQQDIALRAEQRAVITKAIQDFQTKVVDLQWRMQDHLADSDQEHALSRAAGQARRGAGDGGASRPAGLLILLRP